MTGPGHETSDVTDGRLGRVALALGLLIGVGFTAASLTRFVVGAPPERAAGAVGAWQAGDRPAPTDELRAQRLAVEAAWAARAASWEWVDREQGVARIPLDRAEDMLLTIGFLAEGGGEHE